MCLASPFASFPFNFEQLHNLCSAKQNKQKYYLVEDEFGRARVRCFRPLSVFPKKRPRGGPCLTGVATGREGDRRGGWADFVCSRCIDTGERPIAKNSSHPTINVCYILAITHKSQLLTESAFSIWSGWGGRAANEVLRK